MAYTGKDMTQPTDYEITAQYKWASKKLNPTIWNPACMVSPNKYRGATTAYFVYSMGSQHHLETFSITEIPGISLSR